MKQLFPDPEDQRRKEYWYKLGEELTIEGEETPFKPRFAYINKWRDAVKTTNPVFIMTYRCYSNGREPHYMAFG